MNTVLRNKTIVLFQPISQLCLVDLLKNNIAPIHTNSIMCEEASTDEIESYFKLQKKTCGTHSTDPNHVRIALLQLNSNQDPIHNWDQISSLATEAAFKGAQMMFIPEAFDFIGTNRDQTILKSKPITSNTVNVYQSMARGLNIWISLGGFHEKHVTLNENSTSQVSNTHILIDNRGVIQATYRKIHLFDFGGVDGSSPLKESNTITAGNEIIPPVPSPIGNIGLGICYDLRFPEFSRALRSMGADVLTFPSAFTVSTGIAHWETLLRARAIENQCYVIAAAQVGQHSKTRESYGHSMVVDPWGKVIVEGSGDKEELIVAEINIPYVSEVRKKLNCHDHRRCDLYGDFNETGNRFSLPTVKFSEESVPFSYMNVSKEFCFVESKYARGIVNLKCILPGHVLVITKRVAERLEDLTPYEVSDLFLLTQFVQSLMENVHLTSSSTVTIQDGTHAGQTVKHVHVHVIPRKPMDFEQNDTIYLRLQDEKNERKTRSNEEMAAEALFLRDYIKVHFKHKLDCSI